MIVCGLTSVFLLFVELHHSHFYNNFQFHRRHVACYALFTPADLSATKSDRHVCPTKSFDVDAKTSVSDANRLHKEAATMSARRVTSLTKMFVGTGRFVGPILSPSVDGAFAVGYKPVRYVTCNQISLNSSTIYHRLDQSTQVVLSGEN